MSRSMWVLDMDKLPPLITSGEAAQLARCTEEMVTKLCRAGKIKAVRLGRHWRINTDDFLQYLGIDEG